MSIKLLKEDWEAMVVVGRVARSHGLKGEVVVNPETDFPELRFRVGETLYAEAEGSFRAFWINGSRLQGDRPVLAFDGIDGIAEAEELAGCELRIPLSKQHKLPEDVYYEHELEGLEVRLLNGDVVGTVSKVQGGLGASHLLVGRANGRYEVDIPLVSPICVQVDLLNGFIVIDPPSGLLEVNCPNS